jgi:hypothetical protein
VAVSSESALRFVGRVIHSIETEGIATRRDSGPATGEVAADAGDDVSS